MSVTEMNALLLKKTGWTAAWGMALSSAVALGGCVSAFEPKTDPTSPLAPRIQKLVDENRQYPRWADFPRTSTPLPAPAEIAAEVGRLESRNTALTAEMARIDWTLDSDPAAFVESINRRRSHGARQFKPAGRPLNPADEPVGHPAQHRPGVLSQEALVPGRVGV